MFYGRLMYIKLQKGLRFPDGAGIKITKTVTLQQKKVVILVGRGLSKYIFAVVLW
mgnify:CR=1 FL=1